MLKLENCHRGKEQASPGPAAFQSCQPQNSGSAPSYNSASSVITAVIKNPLLDTYWIKSSSMRGFGFGVTAYSREDAFRLLGEAGYVLQPDDPDLKIIEGIKPSDLDQNHVLPNSGPLILRGVWYPFANL